MSLAYIRQRYAVPARRGARVVAAGQLGVITSARGAYIRVRLDGERHSTPWHPAWRMEYLGQTPAARQVDQLASRRIETVAVAGGVL
ncbi:hypothetical protein ACIA8K_06895 [Catenuloplanes sp. NPDC051500]|uniref:hypothetical protein n=1 Tax=Catenuloplanes sp. NPDC051500 TaxID=3363959 RepID=UPI0037AAAC95